MIRSNANSISYQRPASSRTALALSIVLLCAITYPLRAQNEEPEPIIINPYDHPNIQARLDDTAVNDYQQLLDTCLTQPGLIDYQAIADNPDANTIIDAYLVHLDLTEANLDIRQPPLFSYQCVYVNAYNAAVLRAVLLYYPFDTLDEIPIDIFNDIQFQIFGSDDAPLLTLDQIEQLCRQFGDWNIPFALHRPTRNGPILQPQLLNREQFLDQLDQAFTDYLCSCAGLKIDHENQQLLVGSLIWEIRESLIQRFADTTNDPAPTLIAALIPLTCCETRTTLANILPYTPAPMPIDNRIDDIDRRQWYDPPPQNVPPEDAFPCARCVPEP
ncbi:MAG: hypothetical protein JW936_00820 [Sedimentisphaerales bacterium]|nr:hypothetical protein [Sedimentisphaerales bacterium]